MRIWLSQSVRGWWLSCLVLANCLLLCSHDDLWGSYGLLAGHVAELTAGIERRTFLKGTGAADGFSVSNICLPPSHKVCMKQKGQYQFIIACLTLAPAEIHKHSSCKGHWYTVGFQGIPTFIHSCKSWFISPTGCNCLYLLRVSNSSDSWSHILT